MPYYQQRNGDTTAATYLLLLYVAGATPKSQQALPNLQTLCEAYLSGHYALEVVDQQPALAPDDGIMFVPTLVKRLPLPKRKRIGTLANREHVLLGLNFNELG